MQETMPRRISGHDRVLVQVAFKPLGVNAQLVDRADDFVDRFHRSVTLLDEDRGRTESKGQSGRAFLLPKGFQTFRASRRAILPLGCTRVC
jgi:hypothetical protein